MIGIILLIVVVVLIVLVIGIYNRLVALRQNANQAFADIDVQLKQRHDLIPSALGFMGGAGRLCRTCQCRQHD